MACEHVFVSAAAPAASAHILHADLDAFYASVEQRDDPALRGRPVVVGGGVVLSASYEARACGVRSAMGGAQARQLCPAAVVVPPRFAAYSAASKDVFAIFRDLTPVVEGLSIDEAFLDVGGLARVSGTPEQIATRLRRRVRAEAGLPISVGVARTKFLAKVASGVAKPDGLLVVAPEHEQRFLHPLPVERIWGVGTVTAEKLHRRGVRTVAQLAALDEPTLVVMVGKGTGRHLHALAHGRDPRPVHTGRRSRSIGAQCALGRRHRPPEELDATLVALVDRVTRRLRTAHRCCRTITLRMRFGDYSRATRSHTLSRPTDDTGTVVATVRALLAAAQPLIGAGGGLTLVGVALSNLGGAGHVQLELPFGLVRPPVDAALDAVRDRFGGAAVTRATLLGRGLEADWTAT
jgi:DNA polymerase-4